jgi:hypothetical protein
MDHPFGLSAVEDTELFATIVAFRQKYTTVRGISYDNHTPTTLAFLPPSSVNEAWRQDYAEMRENMFYGETLEYDQVLVRLEELHKRFRSRN